MEISDNSGIRIRCFNSKVNMQGTKDFIIQIINPFNESFLTASGMELFADKRFSAEKLANRIGIVIATPLHLDCEINEGDQVMIDPTILYEQIYKLTSGVQESIFLVDKDKCYYKIDPSMVVLYKKNESTNWKGFQENAIYEQVEIEKFEEPLESAFIFIPEVNSEKFKRDRAVLRFANESILEEVSVGQEVIVSDGMGIPFYIDGKTYLWYRNQDVMAVVN